MHDLVVGPILLPTRAERSPSERSRQLAHSRGPSSGTSSSRFAAEVRCGVALASTLIYRKTKNLRAVQLLLGHSGIASMMRYHGIEVDDSKSIEI